MRGVPVPRRRFEMSGPIPPINVALARALGLNTITTRAQRSLHRHLPGVLGCPPCPVATSDRARVSATARPPSALPSRLHAAVPPGQSRPPMPLPPRPPLPLQRRAARHATRCSTSPSHHPSLHVHRLLPVLLRESGAASLQSEPSSSSWTLPARLRSWATWPSVCSVTP